jgi:DNA-binding CsgD family transcriptional regulator
MACDPATDLSLSTTITVATRASVSAPTPARPPIIEPDTVVLSQAAQVLQLSQQGKSTAQIGSSLGLTTAQVNAELGEVIANIPSARIPSVAIANLTNRSGK